MSDEDLKTLLVKVIKIHHRDATKLIDFIDRAWFYATILDQDLSYADFDQLEAADTKKVLEGIKAGIQAADHALDAEEYGALIKQVGKDTGVRGRNLYFPLNITFTGKSSAPEINEIMAVYPSETTIALLDKAIAALA